MKTMKFLIIAVVTTLMSFTNLPNQVKNQNGNALNAITWKQETIELGEIVQGTPKSVVFEFKNTSKKSVIISNVTGTCGCTATDFTKTPIEAGKTGKITATYNAANLGLFSKTVSVTTSAEQSPKILTLKGTVIAPKTETEKI